MLRKLLKRYFSTIFIVATLMGVFHTHHDLKPHNDCQICTIQSSIADADTPTDSLYLTRLSLIHEVVSAKLPILNTTKLNSTKQARAPPKLV